MKKLLVLVAVLSAAVIGAKAQNYVVINSETILKALPEYNAAVLEIDTKAKEYQATIDKATETLSSQYETYMAQRNSFSQSEQQAKEQTIVNNENKITEYQERIFGENGTISTMRKDKLEPIQTRVFDEISKYAKANNVTLVLDIATNPIVVYYDPKVDVSQKIIDILNKK